MNNIFRIIGVSLIATVGLFVMTGVSYGQEMEKGQIEAAGQVGFVSGLPSPIDGGGTLALSAEALEQP